MEAENWDKNPTEGDAILTSSYPGAVPKAQSSAQAVSIFCKGWGNGALCRVMFQLPFFFFFTYTKETVICGLSWP